MVARAYTVAFQGVEARLVEVQCAIAAGLPAFTVVGMPDKAVSEARERVRAAMTAMGLALPAKRITVNLSPAELKGPEGQATKALGTKAVGAVVDFPLAAPADLAGLPRSEVRAIEVDGHTAALVTYGKGLGGIAVIESKATAEGAGEGGSPMGGERLGLPKVAIGSVTGEELDTALGSALWFSRAGVDYAVLGSVPPAAVEAAARGL